MPTRGNPRGAPSLMDRVGVISATFASSKSAEFSTSRTSWCSLGGAVTNPPQSASSHGSMGKTRRFLPPDQTRPPDRRRRAPDETKCPNWRGSRYLRRYGVDSRIASCGIPIDVDRQVKEGQHVQDDNASWSVVTGPPCLTAHQPYSGIRSPCQTITTPSCRNVTLRTSTSGACRATWSS